MDAGLPARLEARLARGRAAAEARHTSRCEVRRDTGRNKVDGVERVSWALQHMDLACRIRAPRGSTGASASSNSGGVTAELGQREWHVKHDTTNLVDGDIILITTGPAAGSFWSIKDATPTGDQQTARRVTIVAAKRPRDWP